MSTYNTKSVKELLSNSKGQLIGKYQAAISVSLLISLIELIITSISDRAFTGSTASYLLSFVITIIIDLLMGILIYGETKFYLNLVRGKDPLMVSDVFYGLKNEMDKTILLQSVFTGASMVASLPALLINLGVLTIPAKSETPVSILLLLLNVVLVLVVKLFCGLCFFILADHPEYSVSEVFKESIRLMDNKKGRYILTCLSLIPVMLLGALAFGVGLLWYVAYKKTVMTNFYLDAINEEPFNPLHKEEPVRESTPESPDDYSI